MNRNSPDGPAPGARKIKLGGVFDQGDDAQVGNNGCIHNARQSQNDSLVALESEDATADQVSRDQDESLS